MLSCVLIQAHPQRCTCPATARRTHMPVHLPRTRHAPAMHPPPCAHCHACSPLAPTAMHPPPMKTPCIHRHAGLIGLPRRGRPLDGTRCWGPATKVSMSRAATRARGQVGGKCTFSSLNVIRVFCPAGWLLSPLPYRSPTCSRVCSQVPGDGSGAILSGEQGGPIGYCYLAYYLDQDPDLRPAVIWPDVGDGAEADQQWEGERGRSGSLFYNMPDDTATLLLFAPPT